MLVLADSDILYKLAACQLLDDLPSLFEVVAQDIGVLPTVRYQASKPSKVLRSKYRVEVFQATLAFVDRVQEVPAIESTLLERLSINKLDPGEAILFGVTSEKPEARLLTGDKRALMALAGAPDLTDLCALLQGRVHCFEMVLRRFLNRMAFEDFLARTVPVKACDGMLRLALSRDLDTSQAQIIEAFNSAIQDLRGQTGLLLAP